MADPLPGSCGCGTVRFEVSEPPVLAAYCHCTRCQKRTGTAAQATSQIVPGSVTVLEGEDALSRWAPEGGFAKVFCRECGSHLFGAHPESGEIAMVRMPSFAKQ